MVTNNPNDESIRLQEQFISMGAKISEAIRDAVRDAADSVDASVAQRVGKSLVSTFTSLARFAEEAAENTFKISQGLLDSEGISKQLLNLEQKRLTLSRQKELAQLAGIAYNEEDYEMAKESIAAQEAMLQKEKAITDSIDKKVGLVGKLAGAMGAIPGLGKIINVKELNAELRKATVELDKDGKLIEKNTNGFGMMAIAAKTVGKQFATAMLDPAAIVGKIVEQFFAINKASVELRRLTGDTAVSFNIFANGAASSVQILETAAELTKQIGFNAQSAFSQDVIANAADLKVEMGLAADEAGGIAMMAQTSGKSVDSITDSVVDTTSAFNRANRSAVSQGLVLRDVAKTSDSIKLSLGNNPKALADAASQAKRLGTDLAGLNQIATSLLEFESSIEAELEAQLLTGNQINLSKARELALNNDLEGLGTEIFKNTVDIEKFGKMGRLGQEAQAKALGMTRDQLARVAYLRALDSKMTDEQASAAAGVNAEEMKRISVQENFTAALNKVMGALAPILEMVGNIFSIPLFGPMLAGSLLLIPSIGILSQGFMAMAGALGFSTAAKVANTGATVSNTVANTGLAASNTVVTASAGPAAGGFAAMGAALGAFGTAAAASIPVLLSIAAVAAGIGIAFYGLAQSLKTIPEILKEITLEKAAAVAILATSFASLAAGLAAVALAGPMALPVLLATGALAAGIGMIATAGGASPGGAAIAGAQKPIESPQAPAVSLSLDPLVTEIKLMREEMTSLMRQFVAKDTTVKMDGYTVGQSLQLSSTSQ